MTAELSEMHPIPGAVKTLEGFDPGPVGDPRAQFRRIPKTFFSSRGRGRQ
jgi:hypothetical protein